MRKRTIGLAAAVGVVTVAIVGYGAASAFVYDELTKVSGDCPTGWADNGPTSFDVVDNDGNPMTGYETFDTAPYLMPEPESVTIPSRDAGIELAGWYIPADDPDAPTVVITHGVSACKRDHTVLLPAGMLHRNGFNVLMFDLRDHGDSTFEDGRYAGGTEEYNDTLGRGTGCRPRKARRRSESGSTVHRSAPRRRSWQQATSRASPQRGKTRATPICHRSFATS